MQKAKEGIRSDMEEMLRELVQIPAPLHGERKRAEYCRKWMQAHGMSGAEIDECQNVTIAYHQKPGKKNILFLAHLDTVFSEEMPLVIREEGTRWYCPGIGDDTANVVAMLGMMEQLWKRQPETEYGAIFALDTGEEGLGNLRGCRALLERYQDRICAVIAFDLYQKEVYPSCIGSVRYELSVRTGGGHSYHDFGKPNAIAILSQIIADLYQWQPEKGAATYNAGVIRGGTSVNTIAQEASVLFEYRSGQAEAMRAGDTFLRKTLKQHEQAGVQVECRVIGERPCMEAVDEAWMSMLTEACEHAVCAVTGSSPRRAAASTDCNIPLSMSIPAVCIGLIRGGDPHTTHEWIEISSLKDGVEIAAQIFDTICRAERA